MYGPTPAVIRLAPDGHPVGRFPIAGTGAREFGIHGAPLEDDSGALFFGAEDDRVYAIGPDGAVLWTVDRGDDVDAPLTLLAPSDLVVASDDGTVALYREGAVILMTSILGESPPPEPRSGDLGAVGRPQAAKPTRTDG